MDSKARINFRFKPLVSSGITVLSMVYPDLSNIFMQDLQARLASGCPVNHATKRAAREFPSCGNLHGLCTTQPYLTTYFLPAIFQTEPLPQRGIRLRRWPRFTRASRPAERRKMRVV